MTVVASILKTGQNLPNHSAATKADTKADTMTRPVGYKGALATKARESES
jgi:hypothetical protein